MNEPRTLTLLSELIESDYAWRIVELSNFKSSLISESNPKAKKAKIRAGVALLYSHWEGFIKKVANLYYQFVSFQNLKIEQLSDSFVSISFRSELNLLQESRKLTLHNQIIKTLIEEKQKVAVFSSQSPIRTSNLKYDVFEDVCVMLAIEPREFEMRYKRQFDRNLQLTIDEDLVHRRNNIAHGDYLDVNLGEYLKLYDVVVNGFLFNFKEVVMDSAQNKKYMR